MVYYFFPFFRESCNTIPRQKCETVLTQVSREECLPPSDPICRQIEEQNCQTITKSTCEEENNGAGNGNGNCRQIEKEICEDVEKKVPKNVTTTECETVPKEICNTVEK